jgi:glucose-1-phosphate thymidylyltransferase
MSSKRILVTGGAGFIGCLRGELTIAGLDRAYLRRGELRVEKMGRGFAWLGAGAPNSRLEAAGFMRTLEKPMGFRGASPEEIIPVSGWISERQLRAFAEPPQDKAAMASIREVL